MFRSLPRATTFALDLSFAAPQGAAAAARPVLPPADLAPPGLSHAVFARAAAEGRMSLDEAIREVRSRYGDVTILKARTKKRNGSRVHTIKFLTDSGRVRTVRVDADTGAIL
jgi:uncharacterized membrane protein YkoI